MRRVTVAMLGCLSLLAAPASATPVAYEMIFEDPAWSGWFVIDDESAVLQNGNRLLYALLDFSITNGVYVFDSTDTYDTDENGFGAIADLHGNVAFFEYVFDDASNATAQAVYQVGGRPDDYVIAGAYINYYANCPPECPQDNDFYYTSELVPEAGIPALLGVALAWGAALRRRR